MCGRGPLRLIAGLALAALAWMSSCTYSPDPKSGGLLCGAGNSCPKGYSCANGRTCWKEGSSPSDGGAPIAPEALIGTWTFQTGTVSTMCSDNSRKTRALEGDFVDMFEGVTTNLIGSFYCDWTLNWVSGKTVLAPPVQTCMSTFEETNFTWTSVTFDFSSSDGQTATLNSRINAAYNDGASVGTCTLMIAGGLTLDP